MKSTFRMLVIVVLMLGVLGQHTTASAAEMYKWKGPGADAYFSIWDESGCVLTDVSVFTRDETFQNPPGKPSKNSFVYVTIYQVDHCVGVELRFAEGFAWIAANDLQVAKKLGSAMLSTTVSLYDWISDTYFDVYVDLTWSATGSPVKEKSQYRSDAPGCKYHSRFQGTFRGAEANGTVTDGSTNYTPWTGSGNIFDASGKDLYIGCI
jgi:hypothetical protein